MPKKKILISEANEKAQYEPILEVEIEASKLKTLLKSLGAESAGDDSSGDSEPEGEK